MLKWGKAYAPRRPCTGKQQKGCCSPSIDHSTMSPPFFYPYSLLRNSLRHHILFLLSSFVLSSYLQLANAINVTVDSTSPFFVFQPAGSWIRLSDGDIDPGRSQMATADPSGTVSLSLNCQLIILCFPLSGLAYPRFPFSHRFLGLCACMANEDQSFDNGRWLHGNSA